MEEATPKTQINFKDNGPRKDGYWYNGELVKYREVIAEDGVKCPTLPKRPQPYPKPDSPNVLCVIKRDYADFYAELTELGKTLDKRLINVIQMPSVKERKEFKEADEKAKASRNATKPLAKAWKENNKEEYQAFKDYRKKRSELKAERMKHKDVANHRKFPIEAFNNFSINVNALLAKHDQNLKADLDKLILDLWEKSEHVEKVVEPVKLARKDWQSDDSDSDSD